LLDLNLYAQAKHISTSDFAIKGEIDFGILVDFDENIHLFGHSQSLIKLGEQANPLTTAVYGIIVGTTSKPANDIAYSGKMDIDSSVNVSIYSSASNPTFSCGVYFNNTSNANITINGVFTINVF
jgi:hypothetical protein